MNTPSTKQDGNNQYHIQRPPHNKREYHGNGKNAWYRITERINDHIVQYVSIRYSYRWHKTVVIFDGAQLMTAKAYRDAEAQLNS